MLPDISKIQNYLKSKGYKASSVRTKILEFLNSYQFQVSAVEIMDYLSQSGLKPNKTTVYRELEMLVRESVIGQINASENRKLYELRSDLGHHHHLICTNCESVNCVTVPENFHQMEQEMSQKMGFKITNHVMEFFGECNKCQTQNC